MTHKHFANGKGEVARQATLCHVTTSTSGKRRGNVLRLFVDGKKENSCPAVHVAKRCSYLQSIFGRHRNIEHNNVRIKTKDFAECLLSILCRSCDFKFCAQFISKICEHFPVIVDK